MATSDLLELHPFSDEVTTDPFRWYKRMRDISPVVHIHNPDLYVVTGYDEITEVLRHPDPFSSTLGYSALGAGYLKGGKDTSHAFGIDQSEMRMLISTDPPEHTRIRRLLSRAFTPRVINELEPRLREIIQEMVDDMVAKAATGTADLVRDLAVPFPVTVIAELLGIPKERRADFRRWSEAMSGGLSDGVEMEVLATAGLELFTFMAEVVKQRTVEPGSDLVSRLVISAGEDNDDPLRLEEIALIAILLLIAGNETTTSLMGNAFNAFANHPDQQDLVWSNPSLVAGAVEEVLRWEGSVQAMLRGMSDPFTLGDVEIPASAVVMMCFGGANRDPRKFADPDRFDVRRGASDHLTFGHGIHFCLGSSLARNEARLAIDALIEAGIEIHPSPNAVRIKGLLLRGFESFPLVAAAGG
jgi:cytochrome P450